MPVLTSKQKEIVRREALILESARALLLDRGYHGLTMARIGTALGCAKATVYQHFRCKEEIIIALAVQSVDKQRALVERAATFRGRPRERMLAVGEATELFARLFADEARIFQIMNGEAITQKASAESLLQMRAAANLTVGIMQGIVRDAIAQGDLALPAGSSPEELIFHFWLLGEAGKAAGSSWMPPAAMGIMDTFGSIMRSSQFLGDGLGWRPLSTQWDYEKSLRRIRNEVFPKEARLAYGE